MAAPVGNQFWKLRSKHGRDKLFKSPELLWAAACEYFQWCDDHPWMQKKAVQKSVPRQRRSGRKTITENEQQTQQEAIPLGRPYTLSGLCLYCDATTAWWYSFRDNMREQNDKGFIDIITRIEETIETQQFEGASVGVFNANIIARKLGLVERQQQEVNAKVSGLNIVVESKQDAALISEIENV